MFFILLHHYADIVGSKFDFLYFFVTRLRMHFEGGRIRPDVLNEISIVLITNFSLNNCDNCKLL